MIIIKNQKINKLKLSKINPWYITKVGIGSAIAIFLAEMLGLSYSPSAGIITLLTIQNTKKETLKVSLKRVISFLLAVLISFILFSSLGYNAWVFGAFVFLFAALSYIFELKDGISMNAVLVTHFLAARRFDRSLFVNEVMILAIGMGLGILINMFMPNYKEEILKKQHLLEEEMKKVLKSMAFALKDKKACLIQDETQINMRKSKDISGLSDQTEDQIIIDFRDLDILIEELIKKAYDDAGNTLLSNTRYMISYLEMRKHQIEVLKAISRNITKIPVLLKQSIPLSEFYEKTADSFHEMNSVKGLLKDLDKLYANYKQDNLPVTREEFEYRAVLFQILQETEYFLRIKRNFVLELEKNKYWNTK